MSKKEQPNGVARRGRYARSTPLGRVAKNFAKASKAAEMALARLSGWASQAEGATHVSPPALEKAVALGRLVSSSSSEAETVLKELETSGWRPPKKSLAVKFDEGDSVKVSKKHREKYLLVYPARVLKSLKVVKVLPSGEIAVRSGSSTFLVAKSHIERQRG